MKNNKLIMNFVIVISAFALSACHEPTGHMNDQSMMHSGNQMNSGQMMGHEQTKIVTVDGMQFSIDLMPINEHMNQI